MPQPPDTTPFLYSWGTAKEEKEKKRQKTKSARINPKKYCRDEQGPSLLAPIISPPTKEQRIQLQRVCKAYMSVNPVESPKSHA